MDHILHDLPDSLTLVDVLFNAQIEFASTDDELRAAWARKVEAKRSLEHVPTSQIDVASVQILRGLLADVVPIASRQVA